MNKLVSFLLATVGMSVLAGHPAAATVVTETESNDTWPTADPVNFAAGEDENAQWTMRELTVAGQDDGRLGAFLLSFGQDQDGELYALTTDNVGPTGATGQVFRIVPGE